MKESRVLWKINSLEKLIAKEFINSVDKCVVLHGPSPSQMRIMHYIFTHQNEDIYQKDLENVLNISRASVSGILHTMERNDIIKRVICNDDVRCKKIILNENAYNVFMQGKDKFLELEKVLLTNISDEDLKMFNNIVDKMQNNLINYIEGK